MKKWYMMIEKIVILGWFTYNIICICIIYYIYTYFRASNILYIAYIYINIIFAFTCVKVKNVYVR